MWAGDYKREVSFFRSHNTPSLIMYSLKCCCPRAKANRSEMNFSTFLLTHDLLHNIIDLTAGVYFHFV